MAVVQWDPFRDFLNIQNELGRAFERTFGEGMEPRAGAWAPAVDVYEQDDHIVIKADLPELKADEVEVSYEDDNLIISGGRKFTEEVKEDQYYRIERRYGSFKRVVPLPADSIKAKEIKPKQIKIEVGETAGA